MVSQAFYPSLLPDGNIKLLMKNNGRWKVESFPIHHPEGERITDSLEKVPMGLLLRYLPFTDKQQQSHPTYYSLWHGSERFRRDCLNQLPLFQETTLTYDSITLGLGLGDISDAGALFEHDYQLQRTYLSSLLSSHRSTIPRYCVIAEPLSHHAKRMASIANSTGARIALFPHHIEPADLGQSLAGKLLDSSGQSTLRFTDAHLAVINNASIPIEDRALQRTPAQEHIHQRPDHSYYAAFGTLVNSSLGNDGDTESSNPESLDIRTYAPDSVLTGASDNTLYTNAPLVQPFNNRNNYHGRMVLAPDRIISHTQSGYWVEKGTSAATALVSGIVTQIAQEHPGMSGKTAHDVLYAAACGADTTAQPIIRFPVSLLDARRYAFALSQAAEQAAIPLTNPATTVFLTPEFLPSTQESTLHMRLPLPAEGYRGTLNILMSLAPEMAPYSIHAMHPETRQSFELYFPEDAFNHTGTATFLLNTGVLEMPAFVDADAIDFTITSHRTDIQPDPAGFYQTGAFQLALHAHDPIQQLPLSALLPPPTEHNLLHYAADACLLLADEETKTLQEEINQHRYDPFYQLKRTDPRLLRITDLNQQSIQWLYAADAAWRITHGLHCGLDDHHIMQETHRQLTHMPLPMHSWEALCHTAQFENASFDAIRQKLLSWLENAYPALAATPDRQLAAQALTQSVPSNARAA